MKDKTKDIMKDISLTLILIICLRDGIENPLDFILLVTYVVYMAVKHIKISIKKY